MPDITWHRTGARTWRVEIVREEDREARRRLDAESRAMLNSWAIGSAAQARGGLDAAWHRRWSASPERDAPLVVGDVND